MTECQADGEGAKSPMELYEKLTEQGDQVRVLKTAKADKVSASKLPCENSGLTPLTIKGLAKLNTFFFLIHSLPLVSSFTVSLDFIAQVLRLLPPPYYNVMHVILFVWLTVEAQYKP